MIKLIYVGFISLIHSSQNKNPADFQPPGLHQSGPEPVGVVSPAAIRNLISLNNQLRKMVSKIQFALDLDTEIIAKLAVLQELYLGDLPEPTIDTEEDQLMATRPKVVPNAAVSHSDSPHQTQQKHLTGT